MMLFNPFVWGLDLCTWVESALSMRNSGSGSIIWVDSKLALMRSGFTLLGSTAFAGVVRTE